MIYITFWFMVLLTLDVLIKLGRDKLTNIASGIHIGITIALGIVVYFLPSIMIGAMIVSTMWSTFLLFGSGYTAKHEGYEAQSMLNYYLMSLLFICHVATLMSILL